MRPQTIGKLAVFLGATLTLLAVAGASAVVYPQYAVFYLLGAGGISLIVGGSLALAS